MRTADERRAQVQAQKQAEQEWLRQYMEAWVEETVETAINKAAASKRHSTAVETDAKGIGYAISYLQAHGFEAHYAPQVQRLYINW